MALMMLQLSFAPNNPRHSGPPAPATLTSSRASAGRYMPMTRFFYLPLLFCSFAYANEVKFENCEPRVCEALFEKAEVGFPIVFGENLTGKTLKVPKAAIGKIIQHGKSFTVCEGTSRIYTIKYQCLKNTECMFITNGSYKNARTKFEQCI